MSPPCFVHGSAPWRIVHTARETGEEEGDTKQEQGTRTRIRRKASASGVLGVGLAAGNCQLLPAFTAGLFNSKLRPGWAILVLLWEGRRGASMAASSNEALTLILPQKNAYTKFQLIFPKKWFAVLTNTLQPVQLLLAKVGTARTRTAVRT